MSQNEVHEEVADGAGYKPPMTTLEYVRKHREYYQMTPEERADLDKPPTPLEFVQSDDYLINGVGPALMEKVDQIAGLMRKHARRSILDYYEIGAVVKEVRDDETLNDGGRYGLQSVKKLAAALGQGKSLIYDVLRLAKAYTRAEIEDVADLRLPSGQPVTWGHLRVLVMVNDPQQRQGLLTRTLANDWNAAQLADEYRRLTALAAPRSQKPAAVRPPRDFYGLIGQKQAYATSFLKRNDAYLEKDGRLLARYFRQVREDQYTEEGARRLETLAADLWDMADAAKEQAAEAEEVAKEYRRKWAARALPGGGGLDDGAGAKDDPEGDESCEAA